jgi:uncharacterized protein YjbI with pentapeptide repeats
MSNASVHPARHTIWAINETGFAIGWLPGQLDFPNHTISLIVKGVFDLKQNDLAVPKEGEAEPLCGDLHHDDNPAASILYESDFVHFKPNADILLSGTCKVPEGKESTFCPVIFEVDKTRRTLHVIGQRFWQPHGSGFRMTDPLTFRKGPLRYEYAFGGTDYPQNHLGKGIDEVSLGDGRNLVPLPNIEDPDCPVTDPDDRPAPAGFGPLIRTWKYRADKAGTYDERWLEKRWPWYPEDFDWSFFNSAPPQQQLSGYLQGDEPYYLQNLIEGKAEFQGHLPHLTVRCFVNRNQATRSFEEVEMHLDTCWVDADNEQMVLVWRGVARTQSEFCEDIEHVYAIRERIGDTPISIDDAQARMQATISSLTEAPPDELDDPEIVPEDDDDAGEVELVIAEMDQQFGPDLRDLLLRNPEEGFREVLRRELDKMGRPPDLVDERERADDQEIETLVRELEQLDDRDAALGREECLRRIAAGEDLVGENLAGIDLSDCDLDQVNLTDAILKGANLCHSSLKGVCLKDANLEDARLHATRIVNSDLEGCDFTNASLEDSRITQCKADITRFTTANLRNATFDSVSLSRSDLTLADMSEARFTRCNLDEADLSECQLNRTAFHHCSMNGIACEGSTGESPVFSKCKLRGANMSESTHIMRGSFRENDLSESIWSNSTLTASDFSGSLMTMADFECASLESSCFICCNLSQARFRLADLRNAQFNSANLFQSSLEKSNLQGANLTDVNLYESETRDCNLENTILDGANLKMTKLFQDTA